MVMVRVGQVRMMVIIIPVRFELTVEMTTCRVLIMIIIRSS